MRRRAGLRMKQRMAGRLLREKGEPRFLYSMGGAGRSVRSQSFSGLGPEVGMWCRCVLWFLFWLSLPGSASGASSQSEEKGLVAALKRCATKSTMIRSYKGVRPTIPSTCYVDESAQIIGDVVLGEHASVWMNTVLRGDVHSIRIGAHSNVHDCSVLHGMKEQYGVLLGEYVTAWHSVSLHGS